MCPETNDNNFDAIFYGSESPMVIFKGPDMIVEMFNKKYHEIYHNRTILGQPLFKAVPELIDSPFPNILKKVFETGEPCSTHEVCVNLINIFTKELEVRCFDTTFSRICLDGKIFSILAVPREVTERVGARKKLEESLFELQEERELRERFVSALSHDLRTPLAVVSMCALILKKNNDTSTMTEMLDRITSSVARADRMIHDLLDANRIKTGSGIPITIQECDLNECLKSVMTDLKDIYGERFIVESSSREIMGFWDIIGIQRILENLVSNAVKYGTPYSTVTIKLSSSTEAVKIQVTNIGEPIPEEEQSNLFNHYSRSRSAEETGMTGWGIGLALVKGLTEAHHGFVTVHSTQKDGTTFTVNLPIDSRKN